MATTTRLGELTGDYVLDVAHTRIGFVARHTLGTRVRGRFDEFDGEARLNGDRPERSVVRVTIRADSVQTLSPERDAIVRRGFLDVAAHPAITFASTGVEQVDESGFKVTGDLAVRGVTRPVTVDFALTEVEHDMWGVFRVVLKGTATIDRRDWGVNWNAATRLLVGPMVRLDLKVAAIRWP